MNEQITKAQDNLFILSSKALKYLVSNFHFSSKEYAKLKLEIGNLTDQIRTALNQAEEKEKEIKLLQEYNFDYVMELNLLREFAEIVIKNIVISKNTTMSNDITFGCGFYNEIIHKNEFSVIKEVVEKYGH